MRTLLEDWSTTLDGMSNFDKSHFLPLVKEHHNLNELRKIFGYFPHSEEMIKRTSDVIKSGSLNNSIYLLPSPTKNKDLLISMAELWLHEQASFFKKMDNSEFYNICNRAKVVVISRAEQSKFYNYDIPTYWFFDFICDEVRKSISKEKNIHFLKEALYGISADHYLSFYILQPLINLEIDFTHYFNFWKIGGIALLTEKEFLISTMAD